MATAIDTPPPSFLDYALRGRNDWWRYVAGLVLGAVLAMALAVAVYLAVLASGLAPRNLEESLLGPGEDPRVFFAATGIMFACVLAGYWAAARLMHGKRFGDLIGAWSWRRFGQGALVWLAALVLLSLVDLAIAPDGFRPNATSQTPALALMALAALIPQTFAEEFVFRGYITQGLLAAIKRPLPTAVISGLIFGAVHIPNGVPQALGATAMGVVLALIAIRTGSLAFSSGLHLINNFYGAVVVVSAQDVFGGSPGLFVQDTPKLMIWDTLAGTAVVLAIAWFVLRNTGRQTRNG